ncbi:MAG: sugar transferase [Fluviicola sp.]|jgi:lipopolysaccharide/colanic/teichoic acid biosynthesis glycosyltransferase
MKRVFDFLVSLIILICFLPFGIILAVCIAIESRGGVFYRQERIGKDEVPFKLWKFRTMRKDSDRLGKLTVGMRDPRITRVGYFIRKSKLDEFPQFLNVFIGQMSIVGPRPEVKEYVDLYNEDQRQILKVKPGITDFASLEFFNENELLGNSNDPKKTYIEEIMPAKIELNKKYIQHPSLGTDIKIMWRTFVKIIR